MVEIYFEKELSDIVFESENLDEWKQLNEELGIKGQIELARGTKSPIPFPYMNEKMKFVAKTLCPRGIELKEYSKTPIPLEVLRQAKFAINENHFQKIQVWYDDKSPDPFLIGITGEYYGTVKGNNISIDILDDNKKKFKNKSLFDEKVKQLLSENIGTKIDWTGFSEKEFYLIARWGDHIRDFKELTQMATDRIIEESSAEMIAKIADMQSKLQRIKENAPLYVNQTIALSEFRGYY